MRIASLCCEVLVAAASAFVRAHGTVRAPPAVRVTAHATAWHEGADDRRNDKGHFTYASPVYGPPLLRQQPSRKTFRHGRVVLESATARRKQLHCRLASSSAARHRIVTANKDPVAASACRRGAAGRSDESRRAHNPRCTVADQKEGFTSPTWAFTNGIGRVNISYA